MKALVVTMLVLIAGRAEAGMCDEPSANQMVRDLEQFAAGKAEEPPFENWILCLNEIDTHAKLKARFFAACEKVMAKDAENKACIRWSVQLDAKTVGSVDLLDATVKSFGLDAWKSGYTGVQMLETLNDPRGVALVEEAWRQNATDKKARSKRQSDINVWSAWRQSATRLIGSVGTDTDLAFLAEMKTAAAPRTVKAAIDKATAAIQKRAAKP